MEYSAEEFAGHNDCFGGAVINALFLDDPADDWKHKEKMCVHGILTFFYFYKGNITMEVDDQLYNFSPRDLILIPPGVYHRIKVSPDQECLFYFVGFKLEFIK